MDLSKVPVVILAGGFGTRLSEETISIPKPMVTIGGKPILWHIMKHYEQFGLRKFVIACGYKGHVIKEWFASYALHNSDVRIDLSNGSVDYLQKRGEDWDVTLVDTGENTMTAGRIRQLQKHLPSRFLATYGDGLADINVFDLMKFHEATRRMVTVTAATPAARFGRMITAGDQVIDFSEKPLSDGGRINAGFFVFETDVFNYIEGDAAILERDVLPLLANKGELSAFQHEGFWRPMDTLRDRNELESIWAAGNPPWANFNAPQAD